MNILSCAKRRLTVNMKYATISRSALIFVVKIVAYGFKIIGLAPYSFRKSACTRDSTNQISLFRHSKLGLVYNLLLVIPVVFVKSKRILEIVGQDGSSMVSALNKIIFTLREFLALTAACLTLISWGFGQKKAVAILNRLLETSNRISSLKQQSIQKSTIVSVMMHLTMNIVLWGTLSSGATSNENFMGMVIFYLTYLPPFIILYNKLQYSAIVEFVGKKIRTVNQYLAKDHELHHSLRPAIRYNSLFVASPRTHCIDKLASIRLLHSVRVTLIELCEEIANFYSLPILFCIFSSFVALFHDVYIIFINNGENGFYLKMFTATHWTLLILVGYIYPVMALAFNVTRTKKEARLTGKIVNKLLVAARKGEEVRYELKQFSRELLHDSDDIFTAYGLFSLDSTLLPSILASAVTYFVVLIQLRPPRCNHELSCNCSIHL